MIGMLSDSTLGAAEILALLEPLPVRVEGRSSLQTHAMDHEAKISASATVSLDGNAG